MWGCAAVYTAALARSSRIQDRVQDGVPELGPDSAHITSHCFSRGVVRMDVQSDENEEEHLINSTERGGTESGVQFIWVVLRDELNRTEEIKVCESIALEELVRDIAAVYTSVQIRMTKIRMSQVQPKL